jgi:hypothetical protein
MTKKHAVFLVVIAVALLFSTSCKDLLIAHVRFQNNSTSKTVQPIWDGINMGTLVPGQITEYTEANPGSHTIKWKNAASGSDLTSLGYPSLVAGNSYTYPYNDN